MPPLIWALLCAGLLIAQFATGLFDLLFPAIAAGLIALLALIPGFGDSALLQFIIWFGLSIGSILWVRKSFPKFFKRPQHQVVEGSVELVGTIGEVIDPIGPNLVGRIRCKGTTWTAKSNDKEFVKGDQVIVLEQDGINLVVDSLKVLEEE